ncbi:TonB-dependent receptor plug domain-containing protein [Caulobacter segnis]
MSFRRASPRPVRDRPPALRPRRASSPSDASKTKRNNYAAYGEVGYTLDKLFLGAAVRYEDYDDASGDTVVGKINGRYELTPWLAIRGAASTGFRAPGLAQNSYAASSSQFRQVNGVLDLLQIKTLPVGSREAIALGAEPLKPEKSKNYSLGVTLEPAPRLTVTLDAYQIDVDGRIAITSTLTGTAVSNILVANGLPSSLSAQYYTNAIDTRTRGVDLVTAYRQELGDYGTLRVTLGYNHNKTKITGIIANPPELAALGSNYVLFDRLSQGYLTKAFPKDKVSLGANWSWNKLNVNLRETRFGSYTVQQNIVANDRSYGASGSLILKSATASCRQSTSRSGPTTCSTSIPPAAVPPPRPTPPTTSTPGRGNIPASRRSASPAAPTTRACSGISDRGCGMGPPWRSH